MSSENDNIISQGNEPALLNVLMYLNIEDVGVQNGWTMDRILDKLGTIYASPDGYEIYQSKHPNGASMDDYKERQRQYQILVNAGKSNEHFSNLVIGNQSRLMKNPSYQAGGLSACTFTDVNGNVHVVYRGTGSGEWIDNGKGVSGLTPETRQQVEAMEYFDRIVELNGYDKMDITIDISGHSKGGNKAQYTTINSKYRDLIDFCYNFDGQGMSPEAIREFIKRYGMDSYLEAVNKMYGFYADNDFVNPLAIPVVPKDHRYYFESVIDMYGITDNKKYHYADAYLDMDGTFSELTSQGNLSKLVETFSRQVSLLPPVLRSKVADFAMNLMQGDRPTVNGDKVSTLDCILGFAIAAPILLADLLFTPQGWGTLNDLGADLIETAKEKFGEIGELGSAFILANISPLLFFDDLAKVVVDDVKQFAALAIDKFNKLCEVIVDKIEEFGKKITEFAADVGDALKKFADNLRETWNKVTQNITEFADKMFNAGKDFVEGVIDAGKDFVDSAVDAGKDFVDGIIDTGKDFVDGLIDTGKDIVGKAWETGKDIAESAVDIGKDIIDGVVDTGKGIVNKVGETGKAIYDKVNEFKEMFLSAVSSFFGGVANGVRRFISLFEKGGAIREAVVDTWNSTVDKAKQAVNSVLGTVKSQISNRVEDFKEGVNSFLNSSKKAISQAGNKGITFVKKIGKKVLQGMGAYMSGKLCVDLIRLADLQKKLGNLERSFGEQSERILKEANKVTSEVRRQYTESYVQQQINSINQTCEQIKNRSRRLCDMLERKTNSLKYVVSHYKDIEKMIIKDVIA